MNDKITTVAIEKCEGYNLGKVYDVVKDICAKANMPDVQGKTVLVKPNILSDVAPELCITTHPEVVRAVVRLLKEKGASRILVGDSPGVHGQTFCGKNSGINAICEEEGAIWCDFTKDPVSKRISGTKATLPVAKAAVEADLVFSVCKFKTHTLMYTTGAVKNLFGTVPGFNKGVCHAKYPARESFAKLIVGLHQTLKPAFCIMDAIIAMEGPGPANGKPRPLNLLLASQSCFATDWAQAVIMGYEDPLCIPILYEAKRQHLIPESVDYPCLDPKDLVVADFDRIAPRKQTRFIRSLVIPFLTSGAQRRKQKREPAPQFDKDKCIACGKCVSICPAKALRVEQNGKRYVTCDYDRCIRCYCCHEMCPADAIFVQRKESK